MEFKFSIGQFVTTLEAESTSELFKSRDIDENLSLGRPLSKLWIPIVMTVIERRYQECPGGSQIHYLCRYHAANDYTEHWFNEIELVAHPELK